ncbi:hypothetical protein BC834DRAFT_966678 [Gloeopeniophorella convolvens]|nr:hypothetical protein BC834DRAFT_966678 [Gloeopeniophorella convolvens]
MSDTDNSDNTTKFALGDFSIDNHSRMRIVIVGAGFSGVIAGARDAKEVPNVDLAIYEKEDGIATSTWCVCRGKSSPLKQFKGTLECSGVRLDFNQSRHLPATEPTWAPLLSSWGRKGLRKNHLEACSKSIPSRAMVNIIYVRNSVNLVALS